MAICLKRNDSSAGTRDLKTERLSLQRRTPLERKLLANEMQQRRNEQSNPLGDANGIDKRIINPVDVLITTHL